MQKWSENVRSAICTLVVLDTDMDKYWYAIDQREQLEVMYKVGKKVNLSKISRDLDS